MYRLKLKDGTELTFTGVNGTNLISESKIDETILSEDNLSEGIFTYEDGTTENFTHLMLAGEMHWKTGEWYYAFIPLSESDILKREVVSLKAEVATATANITVLQSSLTQVAEAVNGIGGKVDFPVIGGDIT